jgi:5-methylcytosine-specific restriction endonuclease McrA
MNRPPTACRTPSCPGTAEVDGYCVVCRPPKVAGDVTLPESKHDYHREWIELYNQARWKHPIRGLRAAILRRDPICTECLHNPSTIVDHILDHRGNIVLFFDPGNVHGVCKPCHDEKTGRMHGSGDRKPEQPAIVGGRVRDYASKVTTVDLNAPPSTFDFDAAMKKGR